MRRGPNLVVVLNCEKPRFRYGTSKTRMVDHDKEQGGISEMKEKNDVRADIRSFPSESSPMTVPARGFRR